MGNQQLRFLMGDFRSVILNAKFGDGHLWKHPECKNYKIIFTSIHRELLEAKMALTPSLFRSGVRIIRKAGAENCFANSKTLYSLASLVHPDITEAKQTTKETAITKMEEFDFGLWYLDDGGFIVRNDAHKFTPRFYLCVGDNCETEKKEELFRSHIRSIYGANYGIIRHNGAKVSDKNKIWYMPHDIGYNMVYEARKVLSNFYKYPKE